MLTTDEGTTPLMVAAGMGRLEDLTEEEEKRALEAAKLAVELGNDVNAANQDGRTALAAAASLGANAIIQFLVENGVDLEAKDRYGQSALSIAQGISAKIDGMTSGSAATVPGRIQPLFFSNWVPPRFPRKDECPG